MNKWAIALLVVLNGFLFAHLSEWIDLGLEAPREPERISAQINASALALAPTTLPAQPSTTASTVVAQGACLQFAALTAEEVPALLAQLDTLTKPLPVSQDKREQFSSFLVYLAPADSLRAAQRKAADLNKLGVEDTFVIPEGNLKWAISLGMFRSREGAQKLISALNQRGIGDVRIEPRTSQNMTVLSVSGLSTEQTQALLGLSGKRAEWVASPCASEPAPSTR